MPGTSTLSVVRAAWRQGAEEPSGGAEEAMARAQRLWAPWIVGAWLIGVIPPSLASPGLAVCLVPTIVVWLGTLVLRPREGWLFAAVATASSIGIIWLTDGGAGNPQTPVAAAWFDTAAVGAGLGMASLRRAVAGVAAISAVSLTSWAVVAATGPLAGGWRTALAWPTATLGVGLALALAVAVIRRGGYRLDQIRAMTESAATEQDIARSARARLHRYARLLHDTVINTLGAVGQGLPPSAGDRLRERCRYDLAQLEAADPAVPDDLVVSLRCRADALGLRLRVDGDQELLTRIRGPRASAATAALGEALLNIRKHSGSDTADLAFLAMRRGVRISLSDSGRGWDGTYSMSGGIAESIITRCKEVGIDSAVHTAPGGGTTLTLDITAPPQPHERAAGLIQAESLALGAVGCGAVAADLTIRTLLTVGLYPAAGGILALGVLLGVLLLAGAVALQPTKPRLYAAWAGLCLALAAIIPLLPDDATGALSWGWWATIAALPLFAALLLLNAPPWVLVTAYAVQTATRVLHQPDHPSNILMPQIAVVAFAAVLLWRVRERIYGMVLRHDAAVGELAEHRHRTLVDLSGQRAGARELDETLTPAREMLRQLAEGSADFRSPDVMSWCADEAAYLRGVSRLGPFIADADVALLPLVTTARNAGAAVRVTVDPHVQWPTGAARVALAETLRVAREGMAGVSALSVTLLHGESRNMITLLADGGAWGVGEEHIVRARDAGLAIDCEPADHATFLEIAWASPDGPAPTG